MEALEKVFATIKEVLAMIQNFFKELGLIKEEEAAE